MAANLAHRNRTVDRALAAAVVVIADRGPVVAAAIVATAVDRVMIEAGTEAATVVIAAGARI